MAEFIQKCPHCNTKLQMQDEWIGMEVTCPHCQNNVIVSRAVLQARIINTVQDVYQPADDEKNCPLCGGVIKAQAGFCKHCRQHLYKKSSVSIWCIIGIVIVVAIYCVAIYYMFAVPLKRNTRWFIFMGLGFLGKFLSRIFGKEDEEKH